MTLQEHIDEVMDYLEFDKIHRAMEALDWRWHSVEDEGTPDIPEIRQFVRKLIREAWEYTMATGTRWYVTASGGFEVKINHDHDRVSVRFVVDEWVSYPEPDNDNDNKNE